MALTKVTPATETRHGRKNAVINGNFDIWQRGTSFNIDNGILYTADRWVGITSNVTALGTVSLVSENPNVIKIQRDVGSTAAESYVLTSVIESNNMKILAGKTVTLSVDLKLGANFSGSLVVMQLTYGTGVDEGVLGSLSGSWAGFSSSNILITTASTAWKSFELTVDIPANMLEMAVDVRYAAVGTAGVDDSISIRNVQLEQGSIATEFEHRLFGEELAACQRYYEKSYNIDVAPGTATTIGMVTGSEQSATGAQTIYNLNRAFVVEKRVQPSISVYGASGDINRVTKSAGGELTFTSIAYPSTTSVGSIGVSNDINTGEGSYRLHFTADAEL